MERLKKSKTHRAAYVASQISIGLPYQIRALRKQRNWDQKRLAEESGMLQPRISAIESPGYGNMNLETLKRVAQACDVALIVRFAPFSDLIRWSDKFSPDDFEVPSFDEEIETIDSHSGNVVAFNYLVTGRTADLTTPTEEIRADYKEKRSIVTPQRMVNSESVTPLKVANGG